MSLWRVAVLVGVLMPMYSHGEDVVRIAFIDPISGTFSATGTNTLHQFEFAAEELVNKKGGVLGGKLLEIVALDNKASPRESQIQLKRAIGEGIQIVAQGNSSAVANALTDAVRKHNRRNPTNRVLYLNYSAVDPALTNDKCHFWHFRFDAHAEIKMAALTDVIAKQENIEKIYIIGQDYSFGKAVAAAAVKYLGEKRPDIAILGNELHPIGRVKDFTPYVTKIQSSGSHAVITGNWGADMVGLGKAIVDAGMNVPIYTYYAAFDGVTATMGKAGKGKIRLVHEGHYNPVPTKRLRDYHRAFKTKYPDHDLSNQRVYNVIEILAKAIDKAGATDPLLVARALEGIEHTTLAGERVYMRREDHQLFQPLQISVHTDEGIEFDGDNSGFGLMTEQSVPLENTLVETSCKMTRPER
jgi:branched-chain amino acid transport system substrate-binding protein|tara:strand:+ start:7798 stop:9036 length:1239 start_codon:yes stop_codon:yes gene_type:complete